MNSYFNSLKEKNETPQKAYMVYMLEKNLWRVGAVSKDALPEVKESFKIQEKINEYCEQLISTENPSFFNLKDEERRSFITENTKYFDYLGIDRTQLIHLINGMYEKNLKKASQEIKNWEDLEILMDQQKYTQKVESSTLLIKKSEQIVDSCGLTSFLSSKALCNLALIQKIENNLEQLSEVVGCHKSQIGGKVFSIVVDTENNDYAGYSNQYFNNKEQKLYVNSKLMHDAFAHEWLHSIDNLLAQEAKMQYTHASDKENTSIEKLLKKSKEANPIILDKMKDTINEKTEAYCHEIIKRYDNFGEVKNSEEFFTYITKVCLEVREGKWNKTNFLAEIKKFEYPHTTKTLEAYLSTELEMLEQIHNGESFNHSLFYSYAEKMDANLVKILGNDEYETYSTCNIERFARLYETYCDIKLKEKNIENTISYIKGSSYIPHTEEMILYMNDWKPVIKDIANLLEKLCPMQINKTEEFKFKATNEVLEIMQKMREPQEIMTKNKLKNR